MMCLIRASSQALDELVGRFGNIRLKYISQRRFIFGLDEAQWASRKYPRSFISSRSSDTFRSIILEVVQVFTRLPIKLVVSDTDLLLEDIQDSIVSGVSRPVNGARLFHELGMFDSWRKLESFVERYIPASILKSHSGRHLQQRMREYLHGR